jgi:hypothetical protein
MSDIEELDEVQVHEFVGLLSIHNHSRTKDHEDTYL